MRLAYNSNMSLVESYLITYRIYVLKNPFTNEVFYVGKTFKELKERLTGHVSSVNSNGINKPKNDYIKGILDQGSKPLIEEVEVIYGTCFMHNLFASYREYFWMDHYTAQGVKLLNHFGVKTNSTCAPYEGYVESVKSKTGSYHYYFCGKTESGYLVYDSEKMEDDGFEFDSDDEEDDDTEEEVFRELTYHPIYDDENPNYVIQSFEEI